MLGFPALETKKGKYLWIAIVPIYWLLAFVIAAAVPQISYLSAFVGAAMILQFSYTFPPILMVGFNVLKDSMTEADHFNPSNGTLVRSDRGMPRLIRGFKVKFWLNSWNVVFFLGSCVTAVLGIYASIIGMIDSFNGASVKSFSCTSPTG